MPTKTQTVELTLWVENQPDGTPGDCTEFYLKAAGAPGPAERNVALGDLERWYRAEFLPLRRAVAAAGHGDAESDEKPSLVVFHRDAATYTSASMSVQRMFSAEGKVQEWADVVRVSVT